MDSPQILIFERIDRSPAGEKDRFRLLVNGLEKIQGYKLTGRKKSLGNGGGKEGPKAECIHKTAD
ncbi:MAG: hypothetical protein AAFY71_24200 [Bacteroidota bacterium]